MTTTDYGVFFSEINNTSYVDWHASADTNYVSFLDTWYGITNDAALWMETPWVITYLNNDGNNTSCFLTPMWDWTDSLVNHKSGPAAQCAIDRPDSSVMDRRHRVRGKGRALQLHFESEAGKPFNLLGWSINFDRNANY